jgi:hypothetical protein
MLDERQLKQGEGKRIVYIETGKTGLQCMHSLEDGGNP